jgi:hypothetical protein
LPFADSYFVCPSCRRGGFVTCTNQAITGVARDGATFNALRNGLLLTFFRSLT